MLRMLLLNLSLALVLASTATNAMSESDTDISERLDCFEDCEKQYKQLKRYARNGSPQAQTLLGLSYKTGEIHGEINSGQAWRWMKRAAKQRFAPAQYYISHWYREGYDKAIDLKRADEYLQYAAEKNYPPALYELGVRKLTNEDNESGMELLEKSAKKGDVEAKQLVAQIKGQPLPEDATTIKMVGPGMVTSTIEQTADDVITVVGSVEDPMFLFDTMLDQIKDLKKYDRPGTTGTRVGDIKCGDFGSRCRVYKPGPFWGAGGGDTDISGPGGGQ